MIAYVDSSVILRYALNEPGPTFNWGSVDGAVSSSLAEVECFRALDRARLAGALDEVAHARSRELIYRLLGTCDVIEPARPILERASMPLPMNLKTLDAIHLATALFYREATGSAVQMVTHDRALARASLAMGLEVIGAA